MTPEIVSDGINLNFSKKVVDERSGNLFNSPRRPDSSVGRAED